MGECGSVGTYLRDGRGKPARRRGHKGPGARGAREQDGERHEQEARLLAPPLHGHCESPLPRCRRPTLWCERQGISSCVSVLDESIGTAGFAPVLPGVLTPPEHLLIEPRSCVNLGRPDDDDDGPKHPGRQTRLRSVNLDLVYSEK